MEKKTIDALHMLVCEELEDIAKMNSLSHEVVDILKDLTETEKNLMKIEKYKKEKENMEMPMDQGYSQRKYYIDADYQPYPIGMQGNSYAQGSPNSQVSYNGGMGNSYAYEPRYNNPMYSMARGYSMNNKEEMVDELQRIMAGTNDERTRGAIAEIINKMNK